MSSVMEHGETPAAPAQASPFPGLATGPNTYPITPSPPPCLAPARAQAPGASGTAASPQDCSAYMTCPCHQKTLRAEEFASLGQHCPLTVNPKDQTDDAVRHQSLYVLLECVRSSPLGMAELVDTPNCMQAL
eukprot:scaffold71887_cov19-Tisochrysis_lutea.AAC.2